MLSIKCLSGIPKLIQKLVVQTMKPAPTRITRDSKKCNGPQVDIAHFAFECMMMGEQDTCAATTDLRFKSLAQRY